MATLADFYRARLVRRSSVVNISTAKKISFQDRNQSGSQYLKRSGLSWLCPWGWIYKDNLVKRFNFIIRTYLKKVFSPWSLPSGWKILSAGRLRRSLDRWPRFFRCMHFLISNENPNQPNRCRAFCARQSPLISSGRRSPGRQMSKGSTTEKTKLIL